MATLSQQKPQGSPELGRSPFWERPSRALPDPEEMPASRGSWPLLSPAVNIALQCRNSSDQRATGPPSGRAGALVLPLVVLFQNSRHPLRGLGDRRAGSRLSRLFQSLAAL